MKDIPKGTTERVERERHHFLAHFVIKKIELKNLNYKMTTVYVVLKALYHTLTFYFYI